MSKTHSWALQKVQEKSLHRNDMITINSRPPWLKFIPQNVQSSDPNTTSTANTCSIKVFPRTIQNHAKAAHLETKLEIDMMRQFTGLGKPQRDTLLRIIDKNARIRQRMGFPIGVFELMQDDTYDYAFKFPQSSHFSKSSQSISANTDTAPHARLKEFHPLDVSLANVGQSTLGDGLPSIPQGIVVTPADYNHPALKSHFPSIYFQNATSSEPTQLSSSDYSDNNIVSESILRNQATSISRLESISEFHHLLKHDDSMSEGNITDDLADLEFPIEEYSTKSKLKVDESDSNDDHAPSASSKSTLEKSPALTPKQKYSHLVDMGKKGLTVGQRTATKQDLEYEAMMEMKLVSTDLQKWVVDVIDNSVNLDPDILAEVNRMSELAAAAMTPGTEKHAVTGSQQIKSLQPTAKALLALEKVDTSGFDVLLNACKPSILEAKPPVRLNVVHEINPPDALVSTLQKNLGMSIIDKKKAGADSKKKVLPEIESSFTYKRKFCRQKTRYGAWYVPPKKWNEQSHSHTKSPETNQADDFSHRRFGGIVQEKLDEINRKREIDYDHFMRELEHGNNNGPASSGSMNGSAPLAENALIFPAVSSAQSINGGSTVISSIGTDIDKIGQTETTADGNQTIATNSESNGNTKGPRMSVSRGASQGKPQTASRKASTQYSKKSN
ncbi:hypothetical protein O5D80_007351 [Batrachochytrium dendrobatidis]|nr:hypothetical protein O5D80_007351 [Batrachochytrium dendrobatidis]